MYFSDQRPSRVDVVLDVLTPLEQNSVQSGDFLLAKLGLLLEQGAEPASLVRLVLFGVAGEASDAAKPQISLVVFNAQCGDFGAALTRHVHNSPKQQELLLLAAQSLDEAAVFASLSQVASKLIVLFDKLKGLRQVLVVVVVFVLVVVAVLHL